MKLLGIFVCMLLPFVAWGQGVISGQVRDAATDEVLPYATVVVKGRNTGAISDGAGRFELGLGENVSPTDTVAVSFVGYITATTTVSELANGAKRIALTQGEYPIETIVVTNRKSRLAKLGHSSGGMRMMPMFFADRDSVKRPTRIGWEVGTAIPIKHDSKIESLGVLMHVARGKRATFRVSFYEMDDHVTPGARIVNKEITFEVAGTTRHAQQVEVDLRPYNIFFTAGREVLVSLTLLNKEGGEGPEVFRLNGILGSRNGLFMRAVGDETWETQQPIKISFTLFLNSLIYL